VRTSGAGNDSLMTMAILGIALAVSITLFGGPAEFARAVNGFIRDAVETGIAMTRSR
jgi:hypothetical protein